MGEHDGTYHYVRPAELEDYVALGWQVVGEINDYAVIMLEPKDVKGNNRRIGDRGDELASVSKFLLRGALMDVSQ